MDVRLLSKQLVFPVDTIVNQCHASSLTILSDGNIGLSFFGGTKEGFNDVAIWFAKRINGAFQVPVPVASVKNVPCWNPVLYTDKNNTVLYYKVGKKIPVWQTFYKESYDSGLTWSYEKELVPGNYGGRGPVKNKPVLLSDGSLLSPASTEMSHWEAFTDRLESPKKPWGRSAFVPFDRECFEEKRQGIIQPTLWEDDKHIVHMLLRSSCGYVMKASSFDFGRSWEKAEKTTIPNNNSGLDLVKTKNGALFLCLNPVKIGRSPLSLLLSEDNGETFREVLTLENEEGCEFSYPAIINNGDRIYLSYTYKRKSIVFSELLVTY